MGKYSSLSQRRSPPKPDQPHAIWRGIGCLMIVIVPLMSFGLAWITTNVAIQQRWPLPSELTGYPVMPALLWNLQGLNPILAWIQSIDNLYLLAAMTALYTVILGAVISFIYAVIYRFVGPPRLGPLDVERPRVKVKKYTR
jgi:hypothetical protein